MTGAGCEPPLVELLGDVAADVGVQAVGALEEEAAVGRDRLLVADQVLEHRGVAAVGVRALDHLVELLRVADEHEVPRGRAHRERVGERDLPGLVDEEVVERAVVLGAREEPGGAGGEVAVGARRRVGRRSRCVELVVADSGLPPLAFFRPLKLEPELAGGVLDRVEQVVDRLVARRGDADALAVREQVRDQPARTSRSCRSRAGPG